MDNPIDFSQAIVRPRVIGGPEDLKTALRLVQTLCLLAQSGVTRLSASELLIKISADPPSPLTASQVGTYLGKLGLKRYLLHGKSRFALEQTQLEAIRKRITTQCEEEMQKLQALVEKYQELPAQIQALEEEVKNIRRLESRQQELSLLIAENQPKVVKVNDLEKKWLSLQAQAKRVDELEKACQELTRKVAELPSLSSRKTTLEEVLQAYQNEDQILAEKEAQLASSLKKLKERNAWADLATLQYNIRLKNQELEQINKQIDEKRSFLDKLLGRHQKGGRS